MEDKWFVYEEGGWLNFHRSWTGICIFRIRLQPTPTGMEVAQAWVNRDKEQYRAWTMTTTRDSCRG